MNKNIYIELASSFHYLGIFFKNLSLVLKKKGAK